MGNDSLDSKQLTVSPPKLKNLIFALIFAVLGAITSVVLYITVNNIPADIHGRIINCIFFAVFLATTVFLFSGMLDSIRNMFALPTFKLNDNEIFICKYGKANLSDLEKTELKKNGKILVFSFKDGSSAVLRCRLSEIPLETVVYAISLRKK